MSDLNKLIDRLDRIALTSGEQENGLLYALANATAELAGELRRVRSMCIAASNTAGCLANGMIPD